jgi:hypothetical protein
MPVDIVTENVFYGYTTKDWQTSFTYFRDVSSNLSTNRLSTGKALLSAEADVELDICDAMTSSMMC